MAASDWSVTPPPPLLPSGLLSPPKDSQHPAINQPNLADYKSEHVRRWVEANSPPNHLQNNNILVGDKLQLKQQNSLNNNNTIDFLSHHHHHHHHQQPQQLQNYWRAGTNKEEMPMLLQQPPSHVLLASAHHETPDQPLDFTMSKFKTKSSATTVASQLKQLTSFTAAQQQMMLLQSNGMYFNRSNNNKSFTRGSSPSSSSEEEGVGPPASSPRSSLPSPGPLRGDDITPSPIEGEKPYGKFIYLLKIASFF
ncbi:hypothetical protein Trydic_g7066 [Trypoxylus dichotomus]